MNINCFKVNDLILEFKDDPDNFPILQAVLEYSSNDRKYWSKTRSVSSVGLEHRLDRAGVVGSNPIHSTSSRKSTQVRVDFLYLLNRELVPEFGRYKISITAKTGIGFSICSSGLYLDQWAYRANPIHSTIVNILKMVQNSFKGHPPRTLNQEITLFNLIIFQEGHEVFKRREFF